MNVLRPELSPVMEEIYQLLKLEESTFVSTVKFVGVVKKKKSDESPWQTRSLFYNTLPSLFFKVTFENINLIHAKHFVL